MHVNVHFHYTCSLDFLQLRLLLLRFLSDMKHLCFQTLQGRQVEMSEITTAASGEELLQ